MMIDTDTVVTFHYCLSNENDQPIENSRDGGPMVFLYGRGAIIPGLEKALMGREKGERFKVSVVPIEGYGLYNEDLKQRVPIKHLQANQKSQLQSGQIVTIDTRHGPRQVTILKVGRFNIDVDSNHPLAGKTLNFDIEIVDVRNTTSEELAHGHAHGLGGHHH